MWSGRAIAGEYMAHHYVARAVRAQKQKGNELAWLKGEIQYQQSCLTDWLSDQNNQSLPYLSSVHNAKHCLLQQASDQKEVADLEGTLADLLALNSALHTQDTTDLLDRAKRHLAYASPTGLGFGALFVILSIGITGVGIAIACPPILVVGMVAFAVGAIAAALSATKIHSPVSHKFFDIARAIQPTLDERSNLFERAPHHTMPAW